MCVGAVYNKKVIMSTSGAQELRTKFLDFFAKRGHRIMPASSLIPDDPSVLFTTAGMQQFKPYYTGELDPMTAMHSGIGEPLGTRRAASIQPCIRTSDIDEVGDTTHLTFFEMLGNFSFGDYFKQEAIQFGYEFVKDVLKLPIEFVTIFGGDKDTPEDKESLKIWQSLGITDIRRMGREDNFWGPTGKEGPCGPTTEIYVNGIEVWNLVFNEYYKTKEGVYEKLKIPGVDTGAGLERTLMVREKKQSVFATSVFMPLMQALTEGASESLPQGATSFEELWAPGIGAMKNLDASHRKAQRIRMLRIVADHLRAAVFLIADGVYPSNLERGYVARRLVRRAVRFARLAKLSHGWWQNGLLAIRETSKDVYPEVCDATVEEAVGEEIEKFSKTLERGLREADKIFRFHASNASIPGRSVFDLYETFGIPIELIEEIAAERGFRVESGFEEAKREHQEVSRAGLEKKFGGHGLLLDTGELKASTKEELDKVTRLHTATHLLQAALRKVLVNSVTQMGSDITPERLRFDFTFPRKVTPEEVDQVEKLMNEVVVQDLPRQVREMSLQEAREEGALAFFRGKYPPIVKVFSFGDFSKEVCGGPHVERTSLVGKVKIVKEEASSAGVRRIRATVA